MHEGTQPSVGFGVYGVGFRFPHALIVGAYKCRRERSQACWQSTTSHVCLHASPTTQHACLHCLKHHLLACMHASPTCMHACMSALPTTSLHCMHASPTCMHVGKIHACMHTRIHAYMHAYMYTCMHAGASFYSACMCMQVCAHVNVHNDATNVDL